MNSVPRPQGNYAGASRFGNLVVTAGITPRRDGNLQHTGSLSAIVDPEAHRSAVELAATNALAAARQVLEEGERLSGILQSTIFLATEEGFTAHSRVADFASSVFASELGGAAVGSRVAVGVASLPGGAPVEIQLHAIIDRTNATPS